MTVFGHRISWRAGFVGLTLPLILAVAVLAVVLPPDGNERAEWVQFIGRFHPLAVHFPIALLLLVPVLELAGRNARLPFLRLSTGFVLAVATLSASVAAMLGWCLARNGGYSGPLLQQHMWGGIALAAVCWLCWFLRTSEHGSGFLYAFTVAAGVGLVAWTGYRGGQLSLGEDHLTEHMPSGLRQVLGVANNAALSTGADTSTFYGARIQPIFSTRCINCHGPAKHKANLRLDSYSALMRGGKDGPVVRPGNVQGSDLFRRITLTPDHDDFMPKESKRPLSADQVKVVELWIGAGASSAIAADGIKDAPKDSASPAAAVDVSFAEIDHAGVSKLRASMAPVVEQLQKQYPNILEYESRGSADLHLNASILGAKFGDTDLAAFAPLSEHIVFADLSRTAITDRSGDALAHMKRLQFLKLMNTGITDATFECFAGLDQLQSLNAFGTRITSAVLPTVAKLPKLAHFYAGQTSIQANSPVPKELIGKVVF
jgi:uncharacterized membrane protein